MENIRRELLLPSLPVEENDHRSKTSLAENPRTKDRLNREKGKQIIDFKEEQPDFGTNRVEELSDSESCTSVINPKSFGIFNSTELLVPLEEKERSFDMIKKRFLSGIGGLVNHAYIVSIHKNTFSNVSGKARIESFKAYAEATAKKSRDGNANIKFAWYGTSKAVVSEIASIGFSKCDMPEKSQLFGFGINLFPENYAIDSVASSIPDEDGLRHVVLCRVILGNLEEIRSGSEQYYPSSVEFDSGVVNLLFPKRYVVWSTSMNTHILPEYVLTFKAPPCLDGFLRSPGSVKKPSSPWMSFPVLIATLSKHISPQKISLIEKYHSSFRERKITRQHMVQVMRQTVGDDIISSIIKSHRAKQQNEGASGLRPNSDIPK